MTRSTSLVDAAGKNLALAKELTQTDSPAVRSAETILADMTVTLNDLSVGAQDAYGKSRRDAHAERKEIGSVQTMRSLLTRILPLALGRFEHRSQRQTSLAGRRLGFVSIVLVAMTLAGCGSSSTSGSKGGTDSADQCPLVWLGR